METLNTKAELLEGLKNVKAVEMLARDSYERDSIIFSDRRIIAFVSSIKKDEDIHINLLAELIKILEHEA